MPDSLVSTVEEISRLVLAGGKKSRIFGKGWKLGLDKPSFLKRNGESSSRTLTAAPHTVHVRNACMFLRCVVFVLQLASAWNILRCTARNVARADLSADQESFSEHEWQASSRVQGDPGVRTDRPFPQNNLESRFCEFGARATSAYFHALLRMCAERLRT